jgi:Zn-finger protein
MLSSSWNGNKIYCPLYGMVTNGSNFVFLKLVQQGTPVYARSKEFLLEEDDQLRQVLQVLKQLGAIVGGQ